MKKAQICIISCGAADKGLEQTFSRKGFGYNFHPLCVCVCPFLNVTMTRRCFSVLSTRTVNIKRSRARGLVASLKGFELTNSFSQALMILVCYIHFVEFGQ